MYAFLFVILFSSGFFLASEIAAAEDCPVQLAPGNFEFRQDRSRASGLLGESGIVPKGFVELEDGTATVHGIDVSKWQSSVNFGQVKRCGARFAYIRLSAGEKEDNELEYRSMWGNARAENLLVGPYHYLTLIDARGSYQSLGAADRAKLIRRNVESARSQAQLLMRRLVEVLSLDPVQAGDKPNTLGQPYLPIVLAVSRRLQPRGSAADKLEAGEIYHAAICAWIAEVKNHRTFKEQPVWLFTLPYISKDYAFGQAECRLDKMPVWISHHTRDGNRELAEQNPKLREVVAEFCAPAGAPNRCIIQQYTSFGGFALFQRNEGLDMNRFYGREADLRNWLQNATR